MARFFEVIGLNWREFEYQKWNSASREIPVGDSFEDQRGPVGFYFGAKFGQKPGMWLIDPWKKKLQGAPIPEKMRAELLKYNREQKPGLPFAYPGDEKSRQLDRVTIERYLMDTYGLSRETIQTFMAEEGGGFGAGPDVVSAYCIYAFDVDRSIDKPSLSFPGGNDGIARHMVKRLIPDAISGPNSLEAVCRNNIDFQALDRPGQPTRIRLASTAVWVQHEGNPSTSNFVTVAYSPRRQAVPHQSAIRGHGRRLLDDKASNSRPACHPSASLRSVLPFALHDGECSSAQLAISLQIGCLRMSMV